MVNLIKLMLLGIGLFSIFNAKSQEVEKLTFVEKFQQGGNPTVTSILPKEQRLSSGYQGTIKINWSGEVPDSVRICAEVAADIWCSCLDNNDTIRLECHYEELDNNNDVEVEVLYRPKTDIYYPTSLYSHLWGVDFGELTNADAEIYINKKMVWDCSHNEIIIPSARNMTYAMMRAIAISLGFGSSVTKKTIRGNEIIVNQVARFLILLYSLLMGYI